MRRSHRTTKKSRHKQEFYFILFFQNLFFFLLRRRRLRNLSKVTDLAAPGQKLRHHFADGKRGENVWPARVIHGLVPLLFTDNLSHSFSKLRSRFGGLLQNVFVRPL